MSGKLKNVLAVRKMLEGTHRTQTRKAFSFFTPPDKSDWTAKEIGETWEEFDANGEVSQIITKHGLSTYSRVDPVIHAHKDDIIRFAKCMHEPCECRFSPSRLDLKMDKKVGMCLNCVTEHDTALKIRGEFKEYERNKMYNNAVAHFKDADVEMEKVLTNIRSGVGYAESSGVIESWTSSGDNPNDIADRLLAEYTEYKNSILESFNKKDII